MPPWLKAYRANLLPGDLGAGALVALIMVPQGMAYALVAGLPPVAGIYASILPAIAYAAFGSSTTQSVGPQAVIALLTATVLAPLAAPGSSAYSLLASQLALLAGLLLALGAVLRAGVLAAYLSRPVMSGYTNGAVVLIALSQFDNLLGRTPAGADSASATLGLGCLALLLLASGRSARVLQSGGAPERVALALARLVPIAVLVAATVLVEARGAETAHIARIGAVPRGLPALGLSFDTAQWRALLVPALLLAVMVFLQSLSAAQTLARLRGETIDPNRELAGLGAANLAAAMSGAFPVTGGIARSALSHAAGARSPLAGVFAALFLALAVVAPTDWLAPLPLPALAATIIAAVVTMFDWRSLREAWRFDRGEAAAHAVTLAGVLALGVERGIVLGIALSLGLLLWRASHPQIVEVGRRPGSEHFRKLGRSEVETLPHVLLLRVDQGLFFANVSALVTVVEQALADRPGLRHVVLLMSAVPNVDFSATAALRELDRDLARRGVALHLAELKEPVLEQLRRGPLPGELRGRMHRSAARAWDALAAGDQLRGSNGPGRG